jgi:hypothetical protein
LPVFSSSIKILFALKTPTDFNRRRKDWQFQLYSEDTKRTLIEEKTDNTNFILKTPRTLIKEEKTGNTNFTLKTAIKVLWCLQSKVDIASFFFFD